MKRLAWCVLLGLLVLGAVAPVSARPAAVSVTVDLPIRYDARILAVVPNQADGGIAAIVVGLGGGGNTQRSVIDADWSGIPAAASITAVELHLTLSSNGGVSADRNGVLNVHRMNVSWQEASVTWNVRYAGQAWASGGSACPTDRECVAIGSVVLPLASVAGTEFVVSLSGIGTAADWPVNGLFLTGDESVASTLYNFKSRESGAPGFLRVSYAIADTPAATATSLPPTATDTPLPPTATDTSLPLIATNTGLAPTATDTGLPATAMNTSLPATVTSTPIPATATATAIPSPVGEGASPLYATFYLVVLGVYGVTYLLSLVLTSGRSTLVAIITVTFIAVSVVSGSYYAFSIAYVLYLLWMIVYSTAEFFKKLFA